MHRLFWALLLLVTACGQTLQLDSRWRDRQIVIDGADQDWGQARYILEHVPISLGVMNDGEHLYLTMLTADRHLQTLVATRGLELWLDPKGGRQHVFGLRLPGALQRGQHGEAPFDGMAPWGRAAADGDALAGAAGRTSRRRPGMDAAGRSLDPRRLAGMFELLRGSPVHVLDSPNDEGRETSAGIADAVQVYLAYAGGRLVYEARLPLSYLGDPQYSITAAAGTRIGLALRVPPPMAAVGLEPDGRGRGGIGGMGDPSLGTNSRRETGPRSAPGESFEQWVRVELAAAG